MSKSLAKQAPAGWEIRAIRRARRYLKQNEGTLARVLNAQRLSMANGTQNVALPEQ